MTVRLTDDQVAAICDATAVDLEIWENDDKVSHGQAILGNLVAAGLAVIPVSYLVDIQELELLRKRSAISERNLDDLGAPKADPANGYGLNVPGRIEAFGVDIARYREALALIAGEQCERSTSGNCWKAGYIRGGRYADDKMCDACVARAALDNEPPSKDWKKDWAVSPAELIREKLGQKGHRYDAWFQDNMRVSRETLSGLLDTTVPIGPELAVRLEYVLGETAGWWLSAQQTFEDQIAMGRPVFERQ